MMLKKIITCMSIFLSTLILLGCQKEPIVPPEAMYHKTAAGVDFSLAIDVYGDLYGMGTQYYGLLANGVNSATGIPDPTLLTPYFNLDDDEYFLSVHAGDRNALALTSNMRLFSWGWNVIGQTGTNKAGGIVLTPTDISPLLSLDDQETIVQIQTGNYHTMLLTSKSRVFGWGLNSYNQIGSGYANILLVRQEVTIYPYEITHIFKLKRGETITHIGLHQALTSRNRYFGWGLFGINADGFQSGSVNDMTHRIDFLETDEVVDQLLGNGSYIMTSKKHIYKTGILTGFIDGKSQTVISYQDISFLLEGASLKPLIVEQEDNIIFVKSNRKVFAYGLNEYGVFGAGHDVRLAFFRITPNERDIEYVYEDIYWEIDWRIAEIPLEVSMSLYHTMMLTNQYRLFIWGRNASGELGDGTFESSFEPHEVLLS